MLIVVVEARYFRMIVVDIGKHQVVVISELPVDSVSPVLTISNDPEQFMVSIFLFSV